MTEDWEQCFLPLDLPYSIKPPSVTACDHCGELMHRDTHKDVDVLVSRWDGREAVTKHFCSEACHQTWYINHLRKEGL